ncbi:tetratricopeptide repeat protein [Rudanella paleaurantiibacter]|uniref:Tetratricopeptide repeat protein n=1 Tax=Rudanella paleaurantiibacter TaxID=2614655 RepID=A0A7J5TRY5_9BACT|nr:tetratricopeptide repeat protein [Rudanella paleaurantiibacter]KAB7725846.1 tetratricopeptide repeat protein [Rudanella paleaurantiibacter]
MQEVDYTKICFAIMPFGVKKVGEISVNFDFIYENVFVPAIAATPLPEGGYLIPKRTDKDFFSANIDIEMFKYIEYSRLTLADITGLNPNVFYELGVRHHAHPTGTAIFRLSNAVIPFDISRIRAFPYEYDPSTLIEESKKFITNILSESLIHNTLDSPVQIALAAQRALGSNIDTILKDAENAIRHRNLPLAINKYKEAIALNPSNHSLHLELGVLFKNDGNWNEAVKHFNKAINLSPSYSDAQRELGIAQNKLYHKSIDKIGLPVGDLALREAIRLNEQDFDAYASLGGILKRANQYEESLKCYQKAVEISRGNPYPLLNSLKLQIIINGRLELSPSQKFQLRRAYQSRKVQTQNTPPFDAPWCYFDLSDIELFSENYENFLSYMDMGLQTCSDVWEAQTHLESLLLISDAFHHVPEFIRAQRQIEETLPFLTKV